MLDYPNPLAIDAQTAAAKPAGGERPLASSPSPSPAVGERLLVVDDDPSNRESLSRRLQRRGYRADMAEDGATALAAIDAAEAAGDGYALILLDVMMPGLSGLEVLAKLRESRPPTTLPIIMATANDAPGDVVNALKIGANDYVTKPLDFPVVLARVQTQLELRRAVRQILELEARLTERNAQLERAAAQTRRDLELAAKVQATFLPSPEVVDGLPVHFAWHYDPCEHVAGDALNLCQLDAHHVGFYVLDVSGHGVAAALTAVAAARLLAPAHDPDTILVDTADDGTRTIVPPREVAARMTARFTFNSATIQFLTCFYGVLDTRSGELTFVSAGHPGGVLYGPNRPPTLLDGSGLPIGIGEAYEQQSITLAPGDRLLLYSDGVSECRAPSDELFGQERLVELVADTAGVSLETLIERVQRTLDAWKAGAPATDDVSLLAIERTAT